MMISSELPEVLAVSDRIVTMRRGRITGEMPGIEANEEKLMELMALDRTARREAGAMSSTVEQGQRGGINFARLLMSFGPLLFLAALIVVFTVMKPSFIDPINLFNILRQISITGLIALGMTFVILTAGIDLSVGSLLRLCGMVAAVVAKGGTANTLSLGTAATLVMAGSRRSSPRSSSARRPAASRAWRSPGSKCRPSSSRSAA